MPVLLSSTWINAAPAEGFFIKSDTGKFDEKLPGITSLFEIGKRYRALYMKN
jgi:hypothetical protein